MTVVLILLFACCANLRRKVPLNFIALGLFVSGGSTSRALNETPFTPVSSHSFLTCIYFPSLSLSLRRSQRVCCSGLWQRECLFPRMSLQLRLTHFHNNNLFDPADNMLKASDEAGKHDKMLSLLAY